MVESDPNTVKKTGMDMVCLVFLKHKNKEDKETMTWMTMYA